MSTDWFVPHFPVTIRTVAKPYEVFSNEAVEGVVGSTILFMDRSVRISKAWIDHGDLMMTLEEIDDAH